MTITIATNLANGLPLFQGSGWTALHVAIINATPESMAKVNWSIANDVPLTIGAAGGGTFLQTKPTNI